MRMRVTASQILADCPMVVGFGGWGVLGSELPPMSVGDQWIDPVADASSEIWVRITTPPTVGNLLMFPDSSFEYTGPSTTFSAQLAVNAADVGAPQPVTITIGGDTPPLAATAASTSSASGALSTSIRMAGASASLSLADTDLNTAIRLRGHGLSASSGRAVLSGASAGLVGVGVTGSLAIGSLGTEIRLSGVGASRSEVWADLKSASVELLGAAQSVSMGLGELRTGIRLAVTARAQSAARAALVGGEPELPPPWRVLRLRYPSRILRLRP